MNLLIFAASLVLFYVVHSILADNKVKTILQTNIIPKRFYRLGFNLIAIATLSIVFIFYQKIKSDFIFQSNFLRLFGWILIITGIIFLIVALLQYNLGEFSGFQQLKNKSPRMITELKTSGINNYVRHPLYFAMLCLIWGYFLYHPTYLFLVVAVIKLEEQKLIEEFGESYKIYKKKVKMLIPFVF